MRKAWSAVRRAHTAAPRIPLVVLTGLDDESLATQALQEGAQDYLIKGQIDARGLLRALAMPSNARPLEEALVRRKGTRPGHAQLHRGRRHLHRYRGKHHLPESRRGKNDRLAACRKRPAGQWPKFSESRRHHTRDHPESHGAGRWAKPHHESPVELHPHPARRT